MKKFLLVLLILFVGLGVGVYFLYEDFNSPASHKSTNEFFKVKEGESFQSISKRLKESDWIKNDLFFRLLHRIQFSDGHVHKGTYELTASMRPQDILKKITSGDIIKVKVTFPEGLMKFEVAKLLEEKEICPSESFLKICNDKEFLEQFNITSDSCEGYLFPTTYHLPMEMPADVVVKEMILTFFQQFPIETHKERMATLGYSLHDVVVMASLIESETNVDAERPIVSSVYNNRLNINMKLECDPTVMYAHWVSGDPITKLSPARGDMKIDSPYNTYLYAGVPPAPISNPGLASLLAALNPAETEFIYFCAKGNNQLGHNFAKTYKEHLENIKIYRGH